MSFAVISFRKIANSMFGGDMRSRKKQKEKKSLSSRLFRFFSHLFCFAFVIVVFLTLVQCTIKKPEAPTWQTSMVIPLAHKTWDMAELIEKLDQENLTVDDQGDPLFFYESFLDRVTLDASFAVGNISHTIAETLGIVDLDPISETIFVVQLGDQFPILPPGSFPDTSFDVSLPLPPLGDFAVVTIYSGFMVSTIVNDFGLDLDTVIVTINDDSLGGQVTQYDIPGGILEGVTAVDTIDLSGKTVSNHLSTLIHCHTPGKPTFLISADKELSTALGMPDGLSVSSAIAIIPRITRNFSDTLDVTSDHDLDLAVVESGQLILSIFNNTDLSDTLSVDVPGLSLNSIPFSLDTVISARGNVVINLDLAGYELLPDDNQDILFSVDAIINSSGVPVTISSTDDVFLGFDIQNISLARVEGTVAPTTADFAGIQTDIDIPEGFDAIWLPEAMIILEITNCVNLAGSYDIDLVHSNGQIKNITGLVAPGTLGNPITTVNQIPIGDFMNPIPESITVNGSAGFGGTGSATPDDYVTAKVTITSPLEFIINPHSPIEGEWESSELDLDSNIVDGFELARFYATFANRLPVGVTAEFLLGGDSATLYTNPDVILGPIWVSAGYVNPVTGTTDSARISTNEVIMDKAMLEVLYNETIWIGEWIMLDTTGSTPVRMTKNDSLTITGYIEVDYTFSDDLF